MYININRNKYIWELIFTTEYNGKKVVFHIEFNFIERRQLGKCIYQNQPELIVSVHVHRFDSCAFSWKIKL